MPSNDEMLKSLGFYVNLKKVDGALKTDCQSAADYHLFLSDVESRARASAAIVGFTDACPLVPLADIALTQMGRWFGYRKDYELLPLIWLFALRSGALPADLLLGPQAFRARPGAEQYDSGGWRHFNNR